MLDANVVPFHSQALAPTDVGTQRGSWNQSPLDAEMPTLFLTHHKLHTL